MLHSDKHGSIPDYWNLLLPSKLKWPLIFDKMKHIHRIVKCLFKKQQTKFYTSSMLYKGWIYEMRFMSHHVRVIWDCLVMSGKVYIVSHWSRRWVGRGIVGTRDKSGSPFLFISFILFVKVGLSFPADFLLVSVWQLVFHFTRLPNGLLAADESDRRGVGSCSVIRDKVGKRWLSGTDKIDSNGLKATM